MYMFSWECARCICMYSLGSVHMSMQVQKPEVKLSAFSTLLIF